MNCREFTEFLDNYLARDLPEAERDVFEEHLAACPECGAYLQNYRQTMRAGRAAFAGEATPEIPEQLIQAILAARARKE